MIILNDIALDEQILTQHFACDLAKCKGACCTLHGGSGAPLRDDEVKHLAAAAPAAMEYLDDRSKDYIKQHGWLEGEPGDRSVNCIENQQCVFVFFEKNVARCALERSFMEGKNEFRKPISCHLFPIRIADFGGPYLYYDRFEECEPAKAHGKDLNLHIADITRDALIREFGEEWVEALDAVRNESKT